MVYTCGYFLSYHNDTIALLRLKLIDMMYYTTQLPQTRCFNYKYVRLGCMIDRTLYKEGVGVNVSITCT